MNVIHANGNEELKRLVERLNKEKHTNHIEQIRLNLRSDEVASFTEPEGSTLLWQVLSHPYSKVRCMNLVLSSPDIVLKTNMLMQVKRWCLEITSASTPPSRALSFELRGDQTVYGQEFSGILRETLTHPNNRVEELRLTCHSDCTLPLSKGPKPESTIRICSALLRPVLESSNNELRKLRLHSVLHFDDDEAKSFSLGLASPNCKVRLVTMTQFAEMSPRAVLLVLDGLCALRYLEDIQWIANSASALLARSAGSGGIEDKSTQEAIVTSLAQLIERPGNQLTSMLVPLPSGMQQNHNSILSKGLVSEHCRLQKLAWYTPEGGMDDTLPIAIALRHPRNQLTSLNMACRGKETAAALGESLRDPNCKLQSLTIRTEGDYARPAEFVVLAEAIAKALQFPNLLEKLSLPFHDLRSLLPFAESLRSPHNRLRDLTFIGRTDPQMSAPSSLLRALRISNVHGFFIPVPWNSFCGTFNEPFFQVLHALLSIKHICRLGEFAWLRLCQSKISSSE